MKYKQITTYYATTSYPVLTTNDTPAKILLGQKMVTVTIFWPLNVKIKPINCMKLVDHICVKFTTLLHNGTWEYKSQKSPFKHHHKHCCYQIRTHKNTESIDLKVLWYGSHMQKFFFYSSTSIRIFTFIFCRSWLSSISPCDVFLDCPCQNDVLMTKKSSRIRTFDVSIQLEL